MEHEKNKQTYKLAMAGLMAALCYVGYAFLPALSADGTKIHFGNAFVVLGAYLLGGTYGGLAGAVGLTAADLIGGYASSAPRTFITKLAIGLVTGLVAHKLGHLSGQAEKKKVLMWSVLAAIAGLGVNCIFEPALKYFWFTVLIPNPDKAAGAIKALVALTSYTTILNAVTNSTVAVILYGALRPALKRAGMLFEVK